MPVIRKRNGVATHGWYTAEEIAQGKPSPVLADGQPPNSLGWWDTIFSPGQYTGTGHQHYFAAVLDQLPETGRWVDVGCGIGEFLAYVASWQPQLEGWGWDHSHVAIDHARQRPGIAPERLAVGSLPDNIPWRGLPFDVATVLEVLEHFSLTDAPRIVKAAVSLAPLTIITVPNGLDFASGHFVWYDLDLFRYVLPAGYTATGQLLPSNKWLFLVSRN
jgi:SAM-dependent methyltransferase